MIEPSDRLRTAARAALVRLGQGLSMFPSFATHPNQRDHRRRVVAFLFRCRFVAHGNRGPVMTDKGREFLDPPRKRRANEYTPHEVDTLRKYFPVLGPTVLAERLGRSTVAVCRWGRRNGVRRHAFRPAWTVTEDTVLRERYASDPWPHLYDALPGRSRRSIKTRASRLGLSRAMPRGFYPLHRRDNNGHDART